MKLITQRFKNKGELLKITCVFSQLSVFSSFLKFLAILQCQSLGNLPYFQFYIKFCPLQYWSIKLVFNICLQKRSVVKVSIFPVRFYFFSNKIFFIRGKIISVGKCLCHSLFTFLDSSNRINILRLLKQKKNW